MDNADDSSNLREGGEGQKHMQTLGNPELDKKRR